MKLPSVVMTSAHWLMKHFENSVDLPRSITPDLINEIPDELIGTQLVFPRARTFQDRIDYITVLEYSEDNILGWGVRDLRADEERPDHCDIDAIIYDPNATM